MFVNQNRELSVFRALYFELGALYLVLCALFALGILTGNSITA
jgi:hypothetical protein